MVEPTESESLAELDRFCDAMIAIRGEIAKVEAGQWPKEDNPLKHAPHTAAALLAADWHAYAREQAATWWLLAEAAEILVAGGPRRQRLRRPQPVLRLRAGDRTRRLGSRDHGGIGLGLRSVQVGIGPSSSHTVGPMRAARLFALRLQTDGRLAATARGGAPLRLARRHRQGPRQRQGRAARPDGARAGCGRRRCDSRRCCRPRAGAGRCGCWARSRSPSAKTDRLPPPRSLPFHANGMRFEAFDEAGAPLVERSYYSVGGGLVVSDEVAADGSRQKVVAPDATVLPHPFRSAAELLALSERGLQHRRTDAPQRAPLAQRRRDRRRSA